MKKAVILVFVLVALLLLFNFKDYTGKVIPRWLLEEAEPDWQKYHLDEEANKDKLYCRTVEDEDRNIVETKWYNFFINPNKIVRIDEVDTTTPNCKYPNYKPIYAKGSNKGKDYSRVLMDEEGNVLETIWYDACTNEIIQTDEGDTTYPGSNSFTGKCYHPDYVIDGLEEEIEEVAGEEEETIVESYVSLGEKVISYFKELFKM